MAQYLQAKYVVLPDAVLEDGCLVVEDGKIAQILTKVPDGVPVTEYSNGIIAPGLVDVHIHGYKGHDVMDLNADGVEEMAAHLPETGVTSWLPTTLTAGTESLNEAVQAVKEAVDAPGAKIQGIFLEGPYFTTPYKGAQNPSYMSDPNIDQLRKWQELSGGIVKKIAIAPEREGVEPFTKEATEMGVHVSLAHSDATYEEAKKAVEAGADTFIHTFNGMRGLHHREPGMVGAAMSLDEAYAEVIADGHHVHPVCIDLLMRLKGEDRLVLITDCMRAGGLGEGTSSLGEFEVIVKDGTARLKDSGNLAGSILTLDQAVRNVAQWGIATPFEALRMASQTPAESVGIDDVCGSIQLGRAADLAVFDANTLDLLATYIDGNTVFTK
ncbi:N-acetylglucosamine-6-phosphate deacetylase [Dolosicoccus paucivorans]|uniref:N-acetylglucosamine-6-phosphate deacetylase n=1 Tax=Dolosicoccus paucivorans TaxID=84521 RepID=UPI0008912002|nr:N-acetylglucosamine-6-phosphate deacetylase [Dolosicoccus paucivorans]SDI36091.1 N-acetylgalactosamine 6-phosphate deacetylase [Dolosicoccus paucivorans]